MRKLIVALVLSLAVPAFGAGEYYDPFVRNTVAPVAGGGAFGSVMTGPNGAVGAPTYSYSASTSTGLYAPAANQCAVTTNGTQAMLWDASQNTTIPAGSKYIFTGRSTLQSPADGYLLLQNNAGTDALVATRYGGSTSSYPMWKRAASSTALAARLADDSADAAVTAAAGTFSGAVGVPAGLVGNPGLLVGTTAGVYQPTGASNIAVETGGTQAMLWDSSQNATAPAAASHIWSGRAQIKSPADGFLQVLSNAGGNLGSLLAGVTIGTADANGITIARANAAGVPGVVQFTNGNQTTNVIAAAYGFRATNTNTGVPSYVPAGNSAVGIAFGDSGANYWTEVITQRFLVAAKTTSYTVVLTDSGKYFHNSAAGGQVTYTLPAATAGVYLSFENTDAGATFTKLLAVGSDKIAYNGTLGTAAGNLVSSAVWTSVRLTCYVAGVWQVEFYTGTWTLT